MIPDERIRLAGEKVERIWNALRTLLQLRANNDVVLRSDVLSKQVGASYAANAFNIFQGAMFEAEIVRVCAIWDTANDKQQAIDRDSLPAVVWLLDDAAAVKTLAQQREADRKDDVPRIIEVPGSGMKRDELEEIARRHQVKAAAAEAQKVLEKWEETKELASNVLASTEYLELKTFRDKYVAHALVETRDEKRGKVTGPPKYGHGRSCLKTPCRFLMGCTT